METNIKCNSCVCEAALYCNNHVFNRESSVVWKSLPWTAKHVTTSKFDDVMAGLRVAHIARFLYYRRRFKTLTIRHLIVFVVLASVVYLQLTTGLFQRYFLQRDFRTEFRTYLTGMDKFPSLVENCTNSKDMYGSFRPYAPTNLNYSKVMFLQSAKTLLTNESIGLLILVKSATENYKKRMAIRKTWGDMEYLHENVLEPGFPTKLAFICGTPSEQSYANSELFLAEKHFNDIILAQFHDCYENNTFKTVLAMRFAVEHVKNFKYLMIVDDDMYVNLSNALSYMQNIPRTKVQTFESDSGATVFYPLNQLREPQVRYPEAKNVSLEGKPVIMGTLIVDASPYRSSFRLLFGSKWTVSLGEYPFNYFPPYIAGGVTLFDKNTVDRLYCGSFYTKHFWIDDVYIGIIAYKLGISLTSNYLMDSNYGITQRLVSKFDDLIALHGLDCPEQLIRLWHSRDLDSLADCSYLTGII